MLIVMQHSRRQSPQLFARIARRSRCGTQNHAQILGCAFQRRYIQSSSTETSDSPDSHNRTQIQYASLESQGIKLQVGYVDIGPRKGPLLLALHGNPGNCWEFQYLFEPLTAAGIRLILPNFPGYGISTLEDASQLWDLSSTQAQVKLLQDFLHFLDIDRVDTLLSSGSGGFTACSFAAQTDVTRSLVLLSSPGFRPTKSLQPYSLFKFVAKSVHSSLFSNDMFERYMKIIHRILGLPTGDEHIKVLKPLLFRIHGIDFKHIEETASLLYNKRSTLPVVHILSKHDRYFDCTAGVQYACWAGVPEDNVSHLDSHSNITQGPKLDTKTYPKCLVFDEGDHHIHAKQPDIVSQVIVQLIRYIRDKKS